VRTSPNQRVLFSAEIRGVLNHSVKSEANP
jgi:hypothetical protein